MRGGGGEAQLTQRLRRSLASRHWVKRNIVIRKIVDDEEREGTTHEIDHVRRAQSGSIALELEWNNKDPFFDRDLENFQRLHAEGVISVGVIVTRGASLQNNIRAIVREWAVTCAIEGFSDLVAYGVRPTARQQGIVERSNADFITAWSHSSRVTSSAPPPRTGINCSSGSTEALATRAPCYCSEFLTAWFTKRRIDKAPRMNFRVPWCACEKDQWTRCRSRAAPRNWNASAYRLPPTDENALRQRTPKLTSVPTLRPPIAESR